MKKIYDYMVIGAGIINSLEAVYLSKLNKKLIIIESTKKIGGAWSSINIFGYKNIENAIHYFLPNIKGIKYLKNNLKFKINIVKKKIYIINFFILGVRKFLYDSKKAKIIRILIKNENFFIKIKELVLCIFKKYKNHSYYMDNGSKEIIDKIKYILKKNKIKINFNSTVKKIIIDKKLKIVKCHVNNSVIIARKIIISHGSIIRTINTKKNNYNVKNITLKRPAVHFLIKDNSLNSFKEAIFANDSLIKYAHDLTSFSKGIKNKKLLVFGLKHDLRYSKKNIYSIFNRIKKYKIIGEKANLLDYHWSNPRLPPISDNELTRIKKKFNNYIEILKTENFTKGIGLYSDKWSKII